MVVCPGVFRERGKGRKRGAPRGEDYGSSKERKR